MTLESALEESSYVWPADGPQRWTETEAGRIWAEARDGGVVLRADLAGLGGASGESVRALRHFLEALNKRLRAARAELSEELELVWIEAWIPADELSPERVNEAAGALIVGARVAKKECAALLDARMAQLYLEFHDRKDGNEGADTHA